MSVLNNVLLALLLFPLFERLPLNDFPLEFSKKLRKNNLRVKMHFPSISCEYWAVAYFLDIPWLGIFLHH